MNESKKSNKDMDALLEIDSSAQKPYRDDTETDHVQDAELVLKKGSSKNLEQFQNDCMRVIKASGLVLIMIAVLSWFAMHHHNEATMTMHSSMGGAGGGCHNSTNTTNVTTTTEAPAPVIQLPKIPLQTEVPAPTSVVAADEKAIKLPNIPQQTTNPVETILPKRTQAPKQKLEGIAPPQQQRKPEPTVTKKANEHGSPVKTTTTPGRPIPAPKTAPTTTSKIKGKSTPLEVVGGMTGRTNRMGSEGIGGMKNKKAGATVPPKVTTPVVARAVATSVPVVDVKPVKKVDRTNKKTAPVGATVNPVVVEKVPATAAKVKQVKESATKKPMTMNRKGMMITGGKNATARKNKHDKKKVATKTAPVPAVAKEDEAAEDGIDGSSPSYTMSGWYNHMLGTPKAKDQAQAEASIEQQLRGGKM